MYGLYKKLYDINALELAYKQIKNSKGDNSRYAQKAGDSPSVQGASVDKLNFNIISNAERCSRSSCRANATRCERNSCRANALHYERSRANRKQSERISQRGTHRDITLEKKTNIEELYLKLKDHSYKFKPVKIINKLNTNGTKRQLGIPSLRDKIVQKAASNILEEVYEPIFLESSHGFRPNRNCHTALKQIKT